MSAVSTAVTQAVVLASSEVTDAQPRVSKLTTLASTEATDTSPRISQATILAAYGPPQTKYARDAQLALLAATAAPEGNVTTLVSQAALLVAYGTGVASQSASAAWTFVMDGHRFYVLPLGPEGDWAYDFTTQEWCQLQTQGFPGINFTHGVMWGLRVMGGDAQYTYLYELDPTQALDEEWREVQHMVTGGIPTRSRAMIGVANFILTASVGLDSEDDQAISLAFSDDNGVTWSQEFDLPLTDMSTQVLIWPALGSFSAPGRVFRITDYSGPVRLDGVDAVLTIGTGADSGIDQDGQKAQ
jgi:hypothetical protein